MRAELLRKIADRKNSSSIRLASMLIKDDEISEIMRYLKLWLPKLTILDLDDNQFSDNCALTLTEHLFNFAQLTELSLQNNNIGRKGAIAIFSLKKTHPKLDILFHGNRIHDVAEMAEIERLSLAEPSTTNFILGKR